MRLHEYYFDNLGGKAPLEVVGWLGKKLAESFGSVDVCLRSSMHSQSQER